MKILVPKKIMLQATNKRIGGCKENQNNFPL